MLKATGSSANANVPLLGSICLALFLLLAYSIWEAFSGVQAIRNNSMRMIVSDLRQGAERNVGRIEHILAEQDSDDIQSVTQDIWLRAQWNQNGSPAINKLYAAITDTDGQIYWHSNPDLEGGHVGRDWYFRKLPAVGENVVQTESEYLTGGIPSVDLMLPIYLKQPSQPVPMYVAEYHVGIPLDIAQQAVSTQIQEFLLLRGVLFVGILLIVLLAATSLYLLAERIASLREVVTASVAEQAHQLSRLAAGLAHEIRNPLHALRLNLHSYKRAQFDQTLLAPAEIADMLEQSNREINRIESLMTELSSFATSEQARHESFDLSAEVEGIVEFLRHEMERQSIEIEVRRAQESLTVSMDPGRLRQILLNLIQNSIDAMPDGGKIMIDISARRNRAYLVVSDAGPGIPEADRDRVFEPFFTHKSDGTGLGLALVRRFVNEADGTIRCQTSESGGASFSMAFPIARLKGKS
jgi:signal transduction histidine kinase